MASQRIHPPDPLRPPDTISVDPERLEKSLWQQLAPHQQKQLAQQLAELIQRIRNSSSFPEKNHHERG